MKRTVTALVATAIAVVPLSGRAQVYPPKPGVEIPPQLIEQMKHDRHAFRFENAWIKKVERVKRNREAYIEDHGFYYRPLLAPGELKELAVTGTVMVPVFCSKYSNTGADPYPVASLDQKLFTGPNSPQTLTQFYNEISYGDITVTGTVYGWHQLSQTDAYYEGAPGCYSTCSSTGNIAQFITETLNAWDGSVDFAQYDNDGPDGIPNSGDDDGFVDFAAFVHPEVGAECNPANNNIWSHRWSLYWANYYQNGSPAYWTSNDPRVGGGFIRVNDYVVQPAWNCDGSTVIDIGVFCHEFGHAFGLPDLYDTDGGSAGIGHWGLMGSGSWNSVTQPAHMSAWSKSELGWVNLIELGTKITPHNVLNVEFNRPVLRANVMNERWRRLGGACAIGGVGTSMRCGLTGTEASIRGWSGEGYGNGWVERVSCEFDYDGSPGPIWLDYDYRYDSESAYDYTYARIDVGGTVSTLAAYDGSGSGSAHIDLEPYLVGNGQSDYTVYFEFQSDYYVSDEDGVVNTTCGPFVFDNVAVNGGGEAYFTDFETMEDGWWVDMVAPSEYFLVENRQPLGSDVNVHGGGGLCIWHIDHDVATSAMGNSGGSGSAPGVLPRGVALEQADGFMDLEWNIGRGDGGDAFPGSSSNFNFDNGTAPNSLSYDGTPTNVSILLTSGNGDPIAVQGSGGWFPPSVGVCSPPAEDNDKTIWLEIDGTGFAHGCSVELANGQTNIPAQDLEWLGKTRVLAEVDLFHADPGTYDVVVNNPGGGSGVLPAGFVINNVVVGSADGPEAPDRFALRQNYPNPFNPTTTIPFDIKERARVTLTVYNIRGQAVRTLVDDTLDARSYALTWDGRNDAGQPVSSGVYFYKLVAGEFQDVRKLLLMK